MCREGYLFRDGVLGRGYYRKDTVRRHCAWAAPVLPAAGAAAGTLPTADGAADGDTGSQGPQQQQQQQAGGGEAARQYIQRLLQAPPNMHSVVADPSRGLLFTASLGPSDCSIRAWRLHQGSSGSRELRAELHRTLTGHTASVLSLALSADGSLLFSGSHDYTVRVWSTADWCCLRTLKGHGGGVRALVAAPDGATLYSAASDNTIRVGGRAMGPGGSRACLLHGPATAASWSPTMPPPPRRRAGLVHAALGVPAHDARPA